MAHEIKVPRLGWTMEEGHFVEWLKQEGEEVRAGEPLFVIEGDKASSDVEAVDSGILRIPPDAPQPGDTVTVGMTLGYLLEAGELPPWENASSPATEETGPPTESAKETPQVPLPSSVPVSGSSGGRVTISPRAARLASQLRVDWTRLEGSGRGGRIVERDIRRAASEAKDTANTQVHPDSYRPMRVDLEGKVALVTGAGRGIGLAIADVLAENGARVVYTDIDKDSVNRASSKHPKCLDFKMDVTDSEEVDRVLSAVVEQAGSLDILVNNAGINTMAHRVPIDEFPLSEWERLLSVDLTGLYLVSRAGARAMRKQRSGRIINVASIVGLVPLRLQCAFVAAKAGVINLTKAMALELGPDGILVNGIAPGSTLTEGTRELFYGEKGKFKSSVQQMLDHIPLGRPATTAEIAVAALFLAAPDNSYMNGAILTVDGGWTAGYTRDF